MRIRPAAVGDRAFVLSSWKRSYHESPVVAWSQRTPEGRAAYYAWVNRVLPDVLEDSRCVMAANPLDPEHVFGWACAGAGILHYAYVKQEYRRQRIARRLLAHLGLGGDAPLRCTHWTDACRWARVDFAPEELR